MEKNRVCCLYRVSTDKQVDYDTNHEADIPMQRKACHRFAEKMQLAGWLALCGGSDLPSLSFYIVISWAS